MVARHAVALLLQPLGAGRQVAHDLGHARADRVGIEHDDVGRHALAQQAAIVEAELGGGVAGDHLHRLLEREGLLLAHPVAEQMRLQRAVHDLRDVGAGVGEGHDRARMLHQLQRLALVLVGDRLDHEELHVALERHVDHQLDRMGVLLPRQLGHATCAGPVMSVSA